MIDGFIYNVEDLFCEGLDFIRSLATGEEKIYGYGVDPLDKINPLISGTFHIIGGKTGTGKTRLMRKMLLHNARKVDCIYITIEDMAKNYALKLYEDCGGYNFLDIMESIKIQGPEKAFNEQKERIKLLNDCHGKSSVGHAFFNSLSLDDLVKLINKYHNKYKIWVIDYVQALKSEIKGVYDKNCSIAETLRAISISYGIIIVGVAQLNRNVDNVLSDRPPTMNDIQGAGFYEQTASSVLLLQRQPKDMGGYFLPTENINLYLYKNRVAGIVKKIMVDKYYTEIEELKETEETLNEQIRKHNIANKKDDWWNK